MVRKTWNKIEKTDETLELLGYNSLYKLSISEMMFIFEAIGASTQKNFPFGTKEDNEIRFEKKMDKSLNIPRLSTQLNIPEAAFQRFNDNRLTLEILMPLIIKNSLIYNSISQSSNQNLKNLLNSKHNIGFALCEPSLKQSSNYIAWNTVAKLSNNFESWIVSGEKNKIIYGNYSHYLLFCRTEAELISTSGSGVVGLIIPADQVEVKDDGMDYFGIKYQKIRFRDVQLSRESSEVIKTQENIFQFLNIKGCGQLSLSAVILGLLKQLLKNTYAYLINEKIGLSKCELVQYKLYQVTSKIYSLESMIYMTAAMFDSFEQGVNLEGESITVKTLATEYGFDVCHELRNIFGSRFPFSSTAIDLIHFFDSFLDTSLENRILIGQNALHHYRENKLEGKSKSLIKAPIYFIKNQLRYKKLKNNDEILTHDMTKYIHHNMHIACDWIESCINRLEHSVGLNFDTYRMVCLFAIMVSFHKCFVFLY